MLEVLYPRSAVRMNVRHLCPDPTVKRDTSLSALMYSFYQSFGKSLVAKNNPVWCVQISEALTVCKMSTVRVFITHVSAPLNAGDKLLHNPSLFQLFCPRAACFYLKGKVLTLDLQWCLCGVKSLWEFFAKLYSTLHGNSQVVSWATPLSLSKSLLVSVVLYTRRHPYMMLLIDIICHMPPPISFCMSP